MCKLELLRRVTVFIMSDQGTDYGLRRLNLGIALMLAASATSGFNASQINSLLVLKECEWFLSFMFWLVFEY